MKSTLRILGGTIAGVASMIFLLTFVLENTANFRRNIGVSVIVSLVASTATEGLGKVTNRQKNSAQLVIDAIKDPTLKPEHVEVLVGAIVKTLTPEETDKLKSEILKRSATIIKDPNASVCAVMQALEAQGLNA